MPHRYAEARYGESEYGDSSTCSAPYFVRGRMAPATRSATGGNSVANGRTISRIPSLKCCPNRMKLFARTRCARINRRNGLSALAVLQRLHARTRLSRRSYAVCPLRGVTWSSVMFRGFDVTPQYAQAEPCTSRSQRRVSAYASRLVETDECCGVTCFGEPRRGRRLLRFGGFVMYTRKVP